MKSIFLLCFSLLQLSVFAQEYVPGKLLVRFAEASGSRQTKTVLKAVSDEAAYPFLETPTGAKKVAQIPEWEVLRRTRVLTFDISENIPLLAAKLSRQPGVELAEPIWIGTSFSTPNDINAQQDYFNLIGAAQAWALQTGSRSVIIAITDTGVDYLHPDLNANLAINPGESGNGKENNGIDDDNNGFIDDVFGWDFADNDNTPLPSSSAHGTHVAGIAAAVTNNGIGIASLSHNVSFLPVRAGVSSIPFGYQAVAYAALRGAHVINCSWGSTRFSQAGLEVVRAAMSSGSLIIGAAGNEGSTRVYYPAGFPEVISVAAINNTSATRASFSNYNVTVDIAAPGVNVYSTLPDNTYGVSGGTSMSAPMVAALAGLLKSAHPDWNYSQLRANILHATRSITTVSQPWDFLLGQGYLWAPDAFGTPRSNLEITGFSFNDRLSTKPDMIFEENEPLELSLTVKNHGASASYNLTFSTASNQLSVVTTNATLQNMQAGEERTITGIRLNTTVAAATNGQPVLFIDANNGGNVKRLVAQTLLRPSYGTLNANTIELTLSANGRLGFVEPASTSSPGSAFIIRREGVTDIPLNLPLLAEGSLMLATSTEGSAVTDAARGAGTSGYNDKFIIRRSFANRSEPGFQTGTVEFASSTARGGHDILVQADMAAWRAEADENYVLLKYTITNGNTPLNNFRAGLYLDFDLPLSAGNDDKVFWSQEHQIVYQIDKTTGPDTLFVAAGVAGTVGSSWLIRNNDTGSGVDFGTRDGFTDEEKRGTMFWGPLDFDGFRDKGPADVSFTIAGRSVNLAVGQSFDETFILAQATSWKNLLQTMAAARTKAQNGVPSDAERPLKPSAFGISTVYPNPFNPSTVIRFEPGNQPVSLKVFDVTGRLVRVLASNTLFQGAQSMNFDASGLTSGVYLVVLSDAAGLVSQKKITLLK
jgi:hypothetical protein